MAYKIIQPPQEPEPVTSPKEEVSGFEKASNIAMQPLEAIYDVAHGGFGSLLSLPYAGISAGIEAAGGPKQQSYEESIISKAFPTVGQVRKEKGEKYPYTKPQGEMAKFVRDWSEDAASLAGPASGAIKLGTYAMGPLRSMGIALVSNVGGEGVKQWTGSEEKGNVVKDGMMMVLSLLNPAAARRVSSDLLSKADQVLPQTAHIGATRLSSQLDSLENQILKGRPRANSSSNEKFVLDEIDKVRGLIQPNSSVNVGALKAQKTSLNDELNKFVYGMSDRTNRPKTRNLAKQLNGAIRETLADYGKHNPQWWKLQSEGDKAHGVLAESNFITKNMERFLEKQPDWVKYMFGAGSAAGLGASGYLAPGISGVASGVYQAAKVAYRMAKSKALARHYGKTVAAAGAQNEKLAEKELNSFVKEAEKENAEKNRYRVIR